MASVIEILAIAFLVYVIFLMLRAVAVFSNFLVRVPVVNFAGEKQFTDK